MRLTPEQRKKQILDAAILLVTCGLWHHLTRLRLAARLDISESLISHHYSSMDDLKDAVMEAGCRAGNLRIIMHGLSIKHPIAVALPDRIKRKAATAQ